MADITGAFVRQRRSLMLVSIILSVVLIFGIEGTRAKLSPGAGSISVDIGNTRVIFGALWLAWGWFVYRYWQHFLVARPKDLQELMKLQEGRVRGAFHKKTLKLGDELVDKLIVEQNPRMVRIEKYKTTMLQLPVRVGWRKIEAAVSTDGRPIGINNLESREELQQPHAKVVLNAPWIWPSLFRAVLPVNIKHRYFSEYWTAFLFASIPPLVVIGQYGPDLIGSVISKLASLIG